MTEPALTKLRLDKSALPHQARWAAGLEVSLPPALSALAQNRHFSAGLSFRHLQGDAVALRNRRAMLDAPPASSRLPVNYRAVPAPLRMMIANMVGRMQRRRVEHWAQFPSWPLDLSADLAADLAGIPRLDMAKTPVLLTHDIDSAEGLDNLVRYFLPLEEAVGARSANYIVPCAWPLNHDLLHHLRERNHEIGVHGFNHANRTPFANVEERQDRISAGRAFGNKYGAIGYRAPSLVRSRDLLHALEPYYSYDSSVPTSGGLFPVSNNGCASARPWRIGGLWELPLSMPRDGSLRFLGHTPREISRIWRDCATLIQQASGIVNLLTHCESSFSGNGPMLAIYNDFIDHIAADDRFEFLRPMDLVARLDGQTDYG